MRKRRRAGRRQGLMKRLLHLSSHYIQRLKNFRKQPGNAARVLCGKTVFGEGSHHAKVILVGEQPGNDEDLAGKPFVGPAGKLLDKALEAAGIDRSLAYVTNVVKHFKWEPRG